MPRPQLLLPVLLLTVPGTASSQDAGSPGKQEPRWDVGAEHGPAATVAFETDEGTWLSLDVHPDGKRIVFSLLGDLYLLPIDGGAAVRISSGPALDVQPRFSPDGARIAFASDRSGCENLWTCDLEGGKLRQISHEKRVTVSGPAWTPDGLWLVGRKRLTDTSSLGTVELWMWHLHGGKGVRLTKKDDQPDAADPCFSPDGRFLYYSARDARYRYDRDVYEGIWQVKRLDLRTGQSVAVTGEWGGAAAPQISPDGATMAFVRRQEARTVIELMDLASGRLRRLADGVERDNQEGFCFHGVFPGYAWTPDGKAVVAAAGGGLWRFEVSSGERTQIPFRAEVRQKLTAALRFPHRLGGERVRARVVRWPVESNDGKHRVFSAFGHLYGMNPATGDTYRLTAADDFEFAPALAPDFSAMAWVSWNDDEGGRLWYWPLPAGEKRSLGDLPGQYANPAFSRDGRRIVYLRSSGAALRGHDLAGELWHEIHWIDLDSGEDHYVLGTKNRGPNRRMPRPQFDSSGDRIFYLEDGKAEKAHQVPPAELVSVKLDGTDRKVHLRWKRAEEARVSPDGHWVVFTELHDAWLTAMPESGTGPVEVDPKAPALPLLQLTEEGGEWVDWTHDGRSLSWTYGPWFHRLDLEAALAFLREKQESAEEAGKEKEEDQPGVPASDAQEVIVELPRARPAGETAYTGARIITMNGDEVLEDGVLVVQGDRIAAVGPAADFAGRVFESTVDLAGATVIPGLFDEHAHLHYSTLDILPQHPWKYRANLAYGVTATHDPSASTQEVFAQSEMVAAGLITGPRIFSTGYILYGAEDADQAVIESLEDARHHIRRMKKLGAFTVKSYMQPAREQRQWLLQAAREEQVMVVPEGGGDLEMDLTMILDGHTTIEHALPFAPLRKDVVTLFARSQTAYTPTLLVAYGGPSGDHWFFQHYEAWQDPRLRRFVPDDFLQPRARIRNVLVPDADWHHIDVAASAAAVVRAGGRVCLGGHGQLQGLGPHWEMWAFVQGGMTPLEALRVATRAPAETLGLDADLGSLEPGKFADFVVLDANPLERIENSAQVRFVVKNGRRYSLEELELQR